MALNPRYIFEHPRYVPGVGGGRGYKRLRHYLNVQPNITSSVLHIVRYILVFILLALYYKLNKSPLPPSEAAYISSIATHFIYCFTHACKASFMAMLTDLYKSVVLLNNIICNFRWKRRPVASPRVTA